MARKKNIDINSYPVQQLCMEDSNLSNLINKIGPISYLIFDDDPFTFLIHEIVEQMLSAKTGALLNERLNYLCFGEITPQKIVSLESNQLLSIGLSNSKVKCIKGISNSIIVEDLVLSDLEKMTDGEVLNKLVSFYGIGNWTAKMYLLSVLDRPDILPYEDAAFLQAYNLLYNTSDRSKKSIICKCEKWKPYSSIATRYLYRGLNTGIIKK